MSENNSSNDKRINVAIEAVKGTVPAFDLCLSVLFPRLGVVVKLVVFYFLQSALHVHNGARLCLNLLMWHHNSIFSSSSRLRCCDKNKSSILSSDDRDTIIPKASLGSELKSLHS